MPRTVHLVTSAHVGGSTGKSTLIQMLVAYLSRVSTASSVTVVVDTSFEAALYYRMESMFNGVESQLLGGYESFSCSTNYGKYLLAVRPEVNNITNIVQVTSLIDSVCLDFGNIMRNWPDIDHIVIETNLPQGIANARNFVAKIKDITQATHLHLWTTWNTVGLTNQRMHVDMYRLVFNIQQAGLSGIYWHYVHNPFTTLTGMPEAGRSPSMSSCHQLTPDSRDITPDHLWEVCGSAAYDAACQELSNEEIWTAAYGQFLHICRRPRNLLPVFESSSSWQKPFLNNFSLEKYRVTYPHELEKKLDMLSDNMYSTIFVSYFDTLNFAVP